MNPLHTTVVTELAALDTAAWDALVPRDEPQLRTELLRAVEVSQQGTGAHYVSVRERPEGPVLGVAVCHKVDVDLLTLASPKLMNVAAKIRRGPFKRLFILRSVTSGPFITNCRPNLYTDPDIEPELATAVAEALAVALDSVEGASLRILFELPEATVQTFGPALTGLGYFSAPSLPGTQLDVRWPHFDAYLADMRKFYRRAVRHDQAAAAPLSFEVVDDFSHLATEVHRLYLNVLERAETTFGCLSRAFFEEFGRFSQSRLVAARETATGRLVGMEILLIGDRQVQDLYAGVDYEFNDLYHTYFNLVYPGIALACELGVERMSTGQTSYAFKSRLGVRPFPLSIFVKHRNPLVHRILNRFSSFLCPTAQTFTHRVFHGEVEETATPKGAVKVNPKRPPIPAGTGAAPPADRPNATSVAPKGTRVPVPVPLAVAAVVPVSVPLAATAPMPLG